MAMTRENDKGGGFMICKRAMAGKVTIWARGLDYIYTAKDGKAGAFQAGDGRAGRGAAGGVSCCRLFDWLRCTFTISSVAAAHWRGGNF